MIEHPSLQRRENSDDGLSTPFTLPNKHTLAAEVQCTGILPRPTVLSSLSTAPLPRHNGGRTSPLSGALCQT